MILLPLAETASLLLMYAIGDRRFARLTRQWNQAVEFKKIIFVAKQRQTANNPAIESFYWQFARNRFPDCCWCRP